MIRHRQSNIILYFQTTKFYLLMITTILLIDSELLKQSFGRISYCNNKVLKRALDIKILTIHESKEAVLAITGFGHVGTYVISRHREH